MPPPDPPRGGGILGWLDRIAAMMVREDIPDPVRAQGGILGQIPNNHYIDLGPNNGILRRPDDAHWNNFNGIDGA